MISIPLPAHHVAKISASGESKGVEKGIPGLPTVYKGGPLQSASHALFHLPLLQSFRAPTPFFFASIANPTSHPSTMAGSGANGKWEASFVTNKAILKLKEAGYLPANVVH